jgi:hypothetical protein
MIVFGDGLEAAARQRLPHLSLCGYAKGVRTACISYLNMTAPEPHCL